MHSKKNKQRGFTLIEIAIVVVISSVVLFAIFKALALYSEGLAKDKTIENIDAIEDAIMRYYVINSRYPCPAPLGVDPDDANYGVEQCADIGQLDADPHIEHPIEISHSPPAPLPLREGEILVGAVPIFTLEPCLREDTFDCSDSDILLTEQAVVDGWGSRLTYVVTRSLTDGNTFEVDGGIIDIQDERQESVLEEEFTAHFAIISHGPNRRGAYNNEGSLISDNCRGSIVDGNPVEFPSAPNTHSERENCDHNDGVYVSGLLNETDPDTRYYDDLISFRILDSEGVWQRTGFGEMANANIGNVGIGDFGEGDQPEADLHVRGDLQAIDLYADSLCDENGANCFKPEFFGGPPKDSADDTIPLDFINTCPPGQAIVKISNNKVQCEEVFDRELLPERCKEDDPATPDINEYEAMIGISNEDGIVCERLFP